MRIARLVPALLVVAVAAVGTLAPARVDSQGGPNRLYVAVDKSQILELREPATKISVANPAIADVQVITPSRLLINGKAVGVTSMVVFSAGSLRSIDLVVHPGPVGATGLGDAIPQPHPVIVQRGDKMSEHLFVRDGDQQWVELGSVKPETEAVKK